MSIKLASEDGLVKADALLSLNYPVILSKSDTPMFLHRLYTEYGFDIKCLADASCANNVEKLMGYKSKYCSALDVLSVSSVKGYESFSCDVLVIFSNKSTRQYCKNIMAISRKYVVIVTDEYNAITFYYLLSCVFNLTAEVKSKPEYLKQVYEKLSVNLYSDEYFYVLNGFKEDEEMKEQPESQPKGFAATRTRKMTRHYANPAVKTCKN